MTHVQQLFIDGEWRDAASGRTAPVHNPFLGETVTEQAAAGADDVEAAVAAAVGARATWARTPGADRRRVLEGAADALAADQAEIVRAMAEETSGTAGWGHFNVALAASMLRAAGALAEQPLDAPLSSEVPGLDSRAVHAPVGVCVGIAPWNAPVILGVRAVAWALALGNTMVFKASEQSPRVHGAIVAALADAGAPAGVVNLLTNDPQDGATVVEALIDHPGTAHINFTGSTRVGRAIAARAAPLLKRTLLELGGKAPLVVLDDADLDAACAAAGFGAFMNAGQICMSTERVIVDRSVHDRFVELLGAKAGSIVAGSPLDPDAMIGPVVTQAASDHLVELVEDARAHGATVAAGGDHEGVLHRATVVDDVTPQMRLYSEESFGPVVAVTAADDVEHAVSLANDTEYGLSAAVFGADEDRAREVATRIRSGICHINGATVHDEASGPFGGVKGSGWGRFGSGQVTAEFTDTRWITTSREPRHYPI